MGRGINIERNNGRKRSADDCKTHRERSVMILQPSDALRYSELLETGEGTRHG